MTDNLSLYRPIVFYALIIICSIALGACGNDAVGEQDDERLSNKQNMEPQITLTISAAASLADPLSELQEAFEQQHSDIQMLFNYAGSGSLARQIEQGAPVDVFISASPDLVHQLTAQSLIDQNGHKPLMTNRLVIVVPSNSPLVLSELTELPGRDVDRIAIGIPDIVPAGSYAEEALINAGIWDDLQPKLVQAKDVRQVLQYVATGNADAGFVYETDARSSNLVRPALMIDSKLHAPIRYEAAIIQSTNHAAEAELFYQFLSDVESIEIFESYGFSFSQESSISLTE